MNAGRNTTLRFAYLFVFFSVSLALLSGITGCSNSPVTSPAQPQSVTPDTTQSNPTTPDTTTTPSPDPVTTPTSTPTPTTPTTPVPLTLSITINGLGTVLSSNGTISCPGTCSSNYTSGSQVTLTTTPSTSWQFYGWTGDTACTGATITLTANTACTAVFLTLQQSIDTAPFGFIDVPADKFTNYNDLGTFWLRGGREATDWATVEKVSGVYDFSGTDTEICNAANNSMNLMYVLRPINSLYGTTWVEGNLAQSNEYPSGHVADYAAFIKAWVERYDGDGVNDAPCLSTIHIKNYQFVHELSSVTTDYWMNHMDQYAEVFAAMYTAMKNSCSDCVLYMPVPPLENLMTGSDFLSTVLGYLQGKGITDIGFDYHDWSMDRTQSPPGYVTTGSDYTRHAQYITRIKSIAALYGFSSDRIVSCESGMAGTVALEKDQAGYVVRMYVSSLGNGQKRILWTSTLEYSVVPDTSIFSHTGLIHNPLNAEGLSSKKLSYYTYKKMVEKLGGSDWNSTTIIQDSGYVSIFKFMKNGSPVYVAWWDYFSDPAYVAGSTKQSTLTGLTGTSALVTVSVPNGTSGQDVTDYTTAFTQSTLTVGQGSVQLNLSEYPVYVEIK